MAVTPPPSGTVIIDLLEVACPRNFTSSGKEIPVTPVWKRLLAALAAVTFILAPVMTITACGGEVGEQEEEEED